MDAIKILCSKIRLTPKKYLSLIGGLFLMLSMAPFFIITATSPYSISYVRKYLGSSVRYSDIIYLMTAFNSFTAISSIVAGILSYKYKVKLKHMAIVGSILTK